jgi:hypothetical protein
MPQERTHGFLRGLDDVTRSRSFEGRFGRMFRNLPSAEFKENDLLALGREMIARPHLVSEGKADPSESDVPAGYTYLGQFIAHDLTFDPVSSLQHDNDPDALVDYRTPRFDLDCLYGRGPADQPYLYEKDVKENILFILGKPLSAGLSQDVPRNKNGRAIIPDPRNDENVILAQMHTIFMRLHNRFAQKFKTDFANVQQLVRWHYQSMIVDDFLRTLINEHTYHEILPHVKANSDVVKDPPKLRFYKPRHEAFMPVEFSAAAYRFGHSMVRNRYRLNRGTGDRSATGPLTILGEHEPGDDLRGFQAPRTDWGIEWDLFFDGISSESRLGLRNSSRVQPAFKIDTALSDPLSRLPKAELEPDQPGKPLPPSLAQRNLLRGYRFGLPSGQAVARAMGEEPLSKEKLTIVSQKGPVQLTDISRTFEDNAPLWFYILAEAQQPPYNGNQLGPVGGRIVMETFVGLMIEDGCSLFRQAPRWRPDGFKDRRFTMAELIKMANPK